MKLQKRLNRKVAGVEYSKWVVTLSPEDVDKLGWKAGEELASKIKDHSLTLIPKHEHDMK
jgi:hypothetical protein